LPNFSAFGFQGKIWQNIWREHIRSSRLRIYDRCCTNVSIRAAADLPLLHRVMLELERERLLTDLNADFDKDRESGRLARLSEIIR
jgi:hypothetical protein